jgi:hypothetical protein
MTSKYQRVAFDEEKLLRMSIIICKDKNGITDTNLYSELNLSVVDNQLCFVTSDGYFMPIGKVKNIKAILETGKQNE